MFQVWLDKGDSRPLWGYLRAQRQDNMGASPLQKMVVILYSDGLTEASILNKQVKAVFNDSEQRENQKRYGPNDMVLMVLT